ncbi:MAG: 3-hydroxyacyl-ACP dehydratase FabZ [Clostridium sp.]|nr:3-hydroxyacyl-ACP dehydratase FabZ [Clostridium sp.]
MEQLEKLLMRENKNSVDSTALLNYLPHRYPMLLIDKILDGEEGEWAIGVKCVSALDPYFQGHYPNRPIMPGSLQLEALSQVASYILSPYYLGTGLLLFVGVRSLRFFNVVRPGDQFIIFCRLKDKLSSNSGVFKVIGDGYVNNKKCVSAEMSFTVDKGEGELNVESESI